MGHVRLSAGAVDRGERIERLARANRFRRGRDELIGQLAGLRGLPAVPEPVTDHQAAATRAETFWAARRAALRRGAAFTACWPEEDVEVLLADLRVFSARLGGRDVWLLVPDREPQCVPVESTLVLHDPLGFGELGGPFASCKPELRLLDRVGHGGLYLWRGMEFFGHGDPRDTWAVEVWGEPWRAAALRALDPCQAPGRSG